MSKASESGKAFIAGVLAKLPEHLRAAAEQAFNDPAAEEALVIVGSGALAQTDINRRYTELDAAKADLDRKQALVNETYDKQTAWWNDHQDYDALKAERDRLAAGGGGDNGHPTPPAAPDLSGLRKEIDGRLAQLEFDGANFMATLTNLGIRHLATFKEAIDTRELLQDKRIGTPKPGGGVYSVVDAYETKYADQLKARHEQIESERINKLVEERLSEERRKNPQQPFPLRNQAPSVLDVLEAANDSPEKHTVDTAADLYEQLAAGRG